MSSRSMRKCYRQTYKKAFASCKDRPNLSEHTAAHIAHYEALTECLKKAAGPKDMAWIKQKEMQLFEAVSRDVNALLSILNKDQP